MNPARHAGPGQGKALLDGRSDRWGPLASQQRAGRPIDTQRCQKGYSFASLTPSLWQFWLAKFSPDLVQGESTRGHIWSRERLPAAIFSPGSVYPWSDVVQGESTRGHIWSRERLPVVRFGPGRVNSWPYLFQAGIVYPWSDLIQGEYPWLDLIQREPTLPTFGPERAYPLLDFTRITADKRLTNVVNEPLSLMTVRASSESVAHTMNAHD